MDGSNIGVIAAVATAVATVVSAVVSILVRYWDRPRPAWVAVSHSWEYPSWGLDRHPDEPWVVKLRVVIVNSGDGKAYHPQVSCNIGAASVQYNAEAPNYGAIIDPGKAMGSRILQVSDRDQLHAGVLTLTWLEAPVRRGKRQRQTWNLRDVVDEPEWGMVMRHDENIGRLRLASPDEPAENFELPPGAPRRPWDA